MTGHKWGHNAMMLHQKGKMKVQCSCGVQSKWFAIDDEPGKNEWWVAHTKLVERRTK